MLVIHIIHKLIKLFTLKRSRKVADFTLKHSRFFAETLPHSIYAFIYLYKKTCSYQLQIVDKLKKLFLILGFAAVVSTSLSACHHTNCDEVEQNTLLHFDEPPAQCFKQKKAIRNQPAQFYTCDLSNDITKARINVNHF